MNIVFIGLRGTGKTTMAKMLSKELSLPWIDTDKELEKKAGMKIHAFVKLHGWNKFRDLEHSVCKECSKLSNHIISTGGGSFAYERNSQLFSQNSIIVWLTLPIHHMRTISGNLKKRPRLTTLPTLHEEIAMLAKTRYPIFKSISDVVLHLHHPAHTKTELGTLMKLLQRVCVPITASTTEEAKQKIKRAFRLGAHLIELRLDLLKNVDIKELPLDRTIVSPRGQKMYSTLTPAFFDLEENELSNKIIHDIKSRGSKIIASFHNYHETPPLKDLIFSAEQLFEKQADIVKVATNITRYSDNATLISLTKHFPKRCIIVGMGEKSEYSRVFTRAYGSVLTYGSLSSSEPSAAGQLEVEEHMGMRIPDSDTKIFGIIGTPVSHSLSPLLHNTLFRKYHYNGIYLRFPCDDLARDFRDLVSLGITGFSVTSPFKEAVIPLLHSVDPLAKRIGAVNTVIRKNGIFIGYNTDWIGAAETLRPFHLQNKRAVVLGCGGASRAVIHALLQLKIGSVVVLRREMMDDQDRFFKNPLITFDTFAHFDRHDYDIVINGTPVSAPISLSLLRPRKIAFDLRYGPSDFLSAAEKKDNTVVNGTTMFAGQAVEQFRLWTSVKPSITEALHALSLGLKRKQKNT